MEKRCVHALGLVRCNAPVLVGTETCIQCAHKWEIEAHQTEAAKRDVPFGTTEQEGNGQ